MMKPLQSFCFLTAVFMTFCCVVQAGNLSPQQSESSLEPEFQQLRAKLRALPEFSGTDANSQFLLAQELAHRGDVQGAVETYRAAIHLKPAWPDPYRGLGQVLLDHHDYADAADALQSSIRLGRDDHLVFYWLGRAHMGTGALAAAAVALEQATKLYEDDAEAFADLGLVKMAQGDVAEAGKALAQSIKLKPDYADAHRLREVLTKNEREPQRVMQEARAILQGLFARE
jgi:tetratricopeptide (TPR) repeat protein